MSINASYRLVRESIVAFTLKYIPIFDKNSPAPLFPPILGTGFIVRSDGVIATNAHVVEAIQRVSRPPDVPKEEWPVKVLLLRLIPAGILEIPLEILGVMGISGFDGGKVYYGPKKGPDLAFVHVKVKGLPTVRIDSTTLIEEGMDIATAGFPMGTDALTAPGWLHQFTPTLQRGIISAVHPFPCPTPHGYSVNVMTQGGASGSPVFMCDSGSVIGVLYAGLNNFVVSLKKDDLYAMPTNISYVVPSHYIIKMLNELERHPEIQSPSDAMTIDDMIATTQVVNRFEKERDWIVTGLDPVAEAEIVTPLKQLSPKSNTDGE